MHHISGTVHHLILVCGNICKMMISPGAFFHFFKILIFWAFRGVKGQKVSQNEK